MAQVTQLLRTNGGNTNSGSGAISSLIAVADYMLCQRPQRITEAIQCLLATLSLGPPPRVEARVKLQIGLTLYHHSNNLLEARQNLEQAMLCLQNVSGMEEVRFEAASVLSKIHMEQGYVSNARKVLRSVLDTSHQFPYWHIRLLLQKASTSVVERDNDSLITTLTQVADYAHKVHAPFTRILCLLNKGAHLLVMKQYQEAASNLSEACSLIDVYNGTRSNQLRCLYMVIQVIHLLTAGLIKTAKPHLKQLQQCVKLLSSEKLEPIDDQSLDKESFEWFTKEQTYVLVYLVTIMHSVMAGNIEKALNYAGKAINLVQHNQDPGSAMSIFQVHLLENIIMCLLMQGKVTLAGSTLQEVLGVCHGHPTLMYTHRAVLHTLLGLYAFATGHMDRSITQFLTALQHTNNNDLKILININLTICYMKQDSSRDNEIQAIMEGFESSDSLASINNSKNFRAAVLYVRGLYAYNQVKLHEAKRHLRETLTLSNNNDLNKLTVCSLILLGRIFLSLGNNNETQDMVIPAYQLASKIQDKRLQVWASALLIDFYHATGNSIEKQRAADLLSNLRNELQKESEVAVVSEHHKLILWTVGDWPVSKPSLRTSSSTDKSEPLRREYVETTPTVPSSNEPTHETHLSSVETEGRIGKEEKRKKRKRPIKVQSSSDESDSEREKRQKIDNEDVPHPSPLRPAHPSTHIDNSGYNHPSASVGHVGHFGHAHNDQAIGHAHKSPIPASRNQPVSHESPLGHTHNHLTGHTHKSPSHIEPTSGYIHEPPVNTNRDQPVGPTHNPSLSHTFNQPIGSAHESPISHTHFLKQDDIKSSRHSIDPPPSYSESISHQRNLPPPGHTHPVPASSGPSPLDMYRHQQQAMWQQQEVLKQKQVQYLQYGASPQQWYQLQAQQQYLLQQKAIIDRQVQQLMISEQMQGRESHRERVEPHRQQEMVTKKEERVQHPVEEVKVGGNHRHGDQSSLWRPVSQPSSQYWNSPRSTGYLTPPASQSPSIVQRTPVSHSPGGSGHSSLQNVLTTPTQMNKSPYVQSQSESPHSGFATPENTHMHKDVPSGSYSFHDSKLQQKHLITPRQLLSNELSRYHRGNDLVPPSPYTEEEKEAILRHQEHQIRQQQQQQQQVLLRQQQADHALLLQHGTPSLTHPQQHPMYVQRFENPQILTPYGHTHGNHGNATMIQHGHTHRKSQIHANMGQLGGNMAAPYSHPHTQ